MISATCGGTISSQLSSPLAMRLSMSREKRMRINRFLFHAAANSGLALSNDWLLIAVVEFREGFIRSVHKRFHCLSLKDFLRTFQNGPLCDASLGGGVNSAQWDGQ